MASAKSHSCPFGLLQSNDRKKWEGEGREEEEEELEGRRRNGKLKNAWPPSGLDFTT